MKIENPYILTISQLKIGLSFFLVCYISAFFLPVPTKLLILVPPAIAVFTMFLYKPVFGLAAMCALIPWEGVAVGSSSAGGATEIKIVGLAVFGCWLLNLFLTGKKIVFNRSFVILLLFISWVGLSLLWAQDFDIAWHRYFTMIQYLFMFLLAINVIKTERDLKIVLGGLILGAIISIPFSINLFFENVVERARIYDAQNPNAYGTSIGLALISSIYMSTRSRNFIIRFSFVIVSAFLLVSLIVAQSRSSWLGIIAASGVFIWYSRHRIRNLILILLVVTAGVIAVVEFQMINVEMVKRTAELAEVTSKGSDRFDIWRVGAEIFKDHPIVGVGVKQFSRNFNRYRYRTFGIKEDMFPGRDPHSMYVTTLVEHGIVGFILFLGLLYSVWREEKLPRGYRPWLAASFLVFLMGASLPHPYNLSKEYWLFLAIVSKISTIRKNELVESGQLPAENT